MDVGEGERGKGTWTLPLHWVPTQGLRERGMECLSHLFLVHLTSHPWASFYLQALSQVCGVVAAPITLSGSFQSISEAQLMK